MSINIQDGRGWNEEDDEVEFLLHFLLTDHDIRCSLVDYQHFCLFCCSKSQDSSHPQLRW